MTSKDLITIIKGELFIFLLGTGINSVMYYKTTSMLCLNYADIGTIGECSAMVPLINSLIYL